MTKLGKFVYDDECVKISEDKFLIRGKETNKIGEDFDTDYEWIKKGYVTITPLIYDKTDVKSLEILKKEF